MEASPESFRTSRGGGLSAKILQDTGLLAASLNASHGSDFAELSAGRVYAAIHQFGGQTKAHVILPKNKKALAFGGRVVAKVNHPGSSMPARPFMPVNSQGDLAPYVEQSILSVLNKYFMDT
nr:phage virion morphogenesis protein [Pseudomethylobacillus aquaticus]